MTAPFPLPPPQLVPKAVQRRSEWPIYALTPFDAASGGGMAPLALEDVAAAAAGSTVPGGAFVTYSFKAVLSFKMARLASAPGGVSIEDMGEHARAGSSCCHAALPLCTDAPEATVGVTMSHGAVLPPPLLHNPPPTHTHTPHSRQRVLGNPANEQRRLAL